MAAELEEYLKEAPGGEHAANARARLEKLRSDYEAEVPAPAAKP